MSLPKIVSRDEWLAARKELLAKEKELTRRRDALSAERRRLPMVEIEKDYRFEGPDGPATLLDMFDGRHQLIVGHFMFDPTWEDGCPSCTAGVDEVSEGLIEHLNVRDTSLAYVSRAPIAKLERYKAKKGWTIPWYSSYGSDFNYDFRVTLDESVVPPEYNYRPTELQGEFPGLSCFLRVGDRVFHTYSTYARGAEMLGGSYYWLDLTALGRQEGGRSRRTARSPPGRRSRTSARDRGRQPTRTSPPRSGVTTSALRRACSGSGRTGRIVRPAAARSTSRISISAKGAPAQRRTPPPKGIHDMGFGGGPSSQRSGRKAPASGQRSSRRRASQRQAATWIPAGRVRPAMRAGSSSRRGAMVSAGRARRTSLTTASR
jgi:predicted dithiol-disulfide oxidoreductase (DUF899 family)